MTARIVCVSMISVSGSITSIIVWGGPRNYNQYRPMIFPCALSWLKTSLLLLPRITKKDTKVIDFKETFFLEWMLEIFEFVLRLFVWMLSWLNNRENWGFMDSYVIL